MIARRWLAFALAAALFSARAAGQAAGSALATRPDHEAEKVPNRLQRCATSPAIPASLAADGVCVRLSGYISTQFTAGSLGGATEVGARLGALLRGPSRYGSKRAPR